MQKAEHKKTTKRGVGDGRRIEEVNPTNTNKTKRPQRKKDRGRGEGRRRTMGHNSSQTGQRNPIYVSSCDGI